MAFLSGYGAAKAKSGKHAVVLDRGKGYSATMAAFKQSSAKSRYPGHSLHYKWQKCPDGSGNDNLRGQG